MKVVIVKSFEKDIKKLKNKSFNKKVAAILEEMIKAEDLGEIMSVKKLQGSETYYRIRIGDYRLGFEYENETVTQEGHLQILPEVIADARTPYALASATMSAPTGLWEE